MSRITMRPVAHLQGCFPQKFGVPRQPGLAPLAKGRVVFEEEFRRDEAVRGLEGFSHLWLVFHFDQVKAGEVRLTVRPPRLGGNEKRGVFATRSPFRPNRIGLSVVKLDRIDREGGEAPVLEVSGIDLVDGTPVLDVKPYVPYADCIEGAEGAFARRPPDRIEVVVGAGTTEKFESLSEDLQGLIHETLSLDARPAYHIDGEEERVYHLCVAGVEVDWVVLEGTCRIVGIRATGEG